MKPSLRRITIGAVLVFVGAFVAIAVRSLSEDRGEQSSERARVFNAETDVTLIVDDGYDGVLAVSPDRKIAGRRVIEGKGPGDPPYSLLRASDHLIVRGQDIIRVPLDGRPPNPLGSATYMVPAVEPDKVWLIGYSGQYIGQGDRTIQQVSLDGTIVTESQLGPDDKSFPSMGIPGGLAFETPHGLDLWNASTQKVVRTLGEKSPFASDATMAQIAWCETVCRSLHLTDFEGEDRLVLPPSGTTHFYAAHKGFARFSPTGRMLAAVARPTISSDSPASIVLVDTTTLQSQVVARDVDDRSFYVGWSPDGSQLFFSSYSYKETTTIIGRHEQRSQHTEIVTLNVSDTFSFVVVEESKTDSFFPAKLGSARNCPSPGGSPSSRPPLCGFELQSSRVTNT